MKRNGQTRLRLVTGLGVAAWALSCVGARAEAPILSATGLLDLRLGAGEGETSWSDGGFGKLAFGGGNDDDPHAALRLARVAANVRLQLTWSLSAEAQLQFDPRQQGVIDEAFVRYRPMPFGRFRAALRAGLFYPPLSLENDGPAWTTTRTITPSAINSWIGEEVKVLGVETSLSHKDATFGEIGVTAAAFGDNDTAGALLTYRGWALHDEQILVGGELRLPTRAKTLWTRIRRQARVASPLRELDNRVGYYAQIAWRPPAPFAFDAFFYDNLGNGHSFERDDGPPRAPGVRGQTSWRTQFADVGARAEIAEGVEILAQAMVGRTWWIPLPKGAPIPRVDDVDFRAAYVLIDRKFEREQGLALRLDAFETGDHQAFSFISTPEHGWAATLAYRRPFLAGGALMLEATHVSSWRTARAQIGEAPQQDQTQLQASLRWSFR